MHVLRRWEMFSHWPASDRCTFHVNVLEGSSSPSPHQRVKAVHNNSIFNMSEQDEEARQSAGASFPGKTLINYYYQLYIYSCI